MTSPTTPETHPRAARPPRSARDFLAELAAENPFSSRRIPQTDPQAEDVQVIHQAQFDRLTSFANRAMTKNQAIGVVVWGESGSGKTNLIRRLEKWAVPDRANLATWRAGFTNFLELQAAPDRLHQALLGSVVSGLTMGRTRDWLKTPLYELMFGLVRRTVPPGTKDISKKHFGDVFRTLKTGLGAGVGNSPAALAAYNLLLAFFESSQFAARRVAGADDRAAAAVRRLSGDGLDADEIELLGFRLPGADAPVDPAEADTYLAVLAQLLGAAGRPLIICVDQINNLHRSQISEVSRLLHSLNDWLKNTLFVLSEVQDELLQLSADGVISQATWDRLAMNKIDMPRLSVADGRRILEARLQTVLTPFEDVPEVSRHFKKDRLFPLGERWFADEFKDVISRRPRQFLEIAKDRWESLQTSLADAADQLAWLAGWPHDGPPPVHRPFGEIVPDAIAGRTQGHLAAPSKLPPNADNVCGLVKALLSDDGSAATVDPNYRGNVYDLRVRTAAPGLADGLTTGLVFITTGSATSVTATLRRLVNDPKPPDKILLVSDQRLPLAFGKNKDADGPKHYKTLKDNKRFEHVELSFQDYARLEALDHVARNAADLSFPLPEGNSRPATRADVVASYRSQGLLTGHPLLKRVLTPPAPPPVLADDDVRRFITGRLGINPGQATAELAKVLHGELPAASRGDLGVPACQARIEAVAKVLAAENVLSMKQAGDGFFLLASRKPAG